MSPRRTLRIARWEVTRGAGALDRRTAAVLAVVLLSCAALAPALVASPPAPGEGVYRVSVAESSPYYAPVAADDQLRAVPPGSEAVVGGRAEVAVSGSAFRVADTEKGRAALADFRSAVAAYNDRRMALDDDPAAAFPVTVDLAYVARGTTPVADGGTPTTVADGGATTTSADATSTDTTASDTGRETTADTAGAPATTLPGAGSGGGARPTTPGGLSPPFPLESLVLAFAFLLPLNVVIQSYGSSVIDERIGRRGEPLLVSPASRGDIVAGKTLPYFAGAAAITAVIALAVGAGVPAVLAVLPLAGLFLGVTFLGALFARSYKELTFVTVAVSVGLTAYAFVPAVFTEVHPIAAISPLSVVVRDVRGDPIALGGFLLSTVPVATAAAVCYALGVGVYREEDLFTQKRLPAKALDALAAPLTSVWRVGLWSALLIPFVLVAELFSVAVLFVVPGALAVPALLALVAVIEEGAKSLPAYAGFASGRFERRDRIAVAVGVASGVGFFLGEKLLLLTRLVGLSDLAVGRAAFGSAELGVGSPALLLAPLALHVAAAVVAALGARRSRRWYAAGLLGAVLLHVAYDYAVVVLLG
ncbi:ABC transporter permease [Halarchaeum sp. CBA1220]|uniref:ABC transporter permease subunit n=1 Tax=Halarchaeum sp. CBA1220 TaxID=1853682 RepID=UPI000F3AA1B1|nr:ABC transporter permease subunit [Halarchaeum sp. CBA1220]QLC34010.1 ABC transporter permease [Halarchaeum sp. CBA1220]